MEQKFEFKGNLVRMKTDENEQYWFAGIDVCNILDADYLAFKIKDLAKENDIEIVEDKPLARMLYANVEVGNEIPPELYQAVAEVLAYVYKLKNKVS